MTIHKDLSTLKGIFLSECLAKRPKRKKKVFVFETASLILSPVHMIVLVPICVLILVKFPFCAFPVHVCLFLCILFTCFSTYFCSVLCVLLPSLIACFCSMFMFCSIFISLPVSVHVFIHLLCVLLTCLSACFCSYFGAYFFLVSRHVSFVFVCTHTYSQCMFLFNLSLQFFLFSMHNLFNHFV